MIVFVRDYPNFISKRLDIFLSYILSLPVSTLYKLSRSNLFLINSSSCILSHRLEHDDRITISDSVFMKNQIFSKITNVKQRPILTKDIINKIQNSIIFQDENLLILNKPYDIACQDGTDVKYAIQDFFPYLSSQPLYIVHRLDKETSGVFILAKNLHTAQDLARKFANHEIEKEYHAFVSPIPKKDSDIIKYDVNVKKDGRMKFLNAETYFEVVSVNEKDDIAFIKILPKTGRKHQIRIHMWQIGTSIIGDKKYHGSMKFSKKLQLFATGIKISDLLIFKAPIESHDHNLMFKLMNCS